MPPSSDEQPWKPWLEGPRPAAVTSLAYDRCEKASLYARAGVPEYWILNRKTVHRDPRPDSEAPFGYGYALRMLVAEHDQVESLLGRELL